MKQRGFTIIELLIVIVIIAILAIVGIVAYNSVTDRARSKASLVAVDQASTDIIAYSLRNQGAYPPTLADADIFDTDDVTYEYTVGTDPVMFCVTATAHNKSSYILSGGKPTEGLCVGHTGIGPESEPPISCPTNFIVVPGNSTFGTVDFCVAKYETKIQGNSNGAQTYNSSYVPESRESGTPWVNISQTNAITEAATACDGCHLITENEWMTILANVINVDSNWSGNSVGSGYIYNGHVNSNPASALAASSDDNDGLSGITGGTGSGSQYNNRRTLTLSNGEVIWDMAGNVNEWTAGTINGGQLGISGESSYTTKQWNDSNLAWNDFPLTSRPSSVSVAAASYGSTQGIGQIYSRYTESGLKAYRRGGSWTSTNFAGVFALSLNNGSGDTINSLGFRIAK